MQSTDVSDRIPYLVRLRSSENFLANRCHRYTPSDTDGTIAASHQLPVFLVDIRLILLMNLSRHYKPTKACEFISVI